ncbi:MAG: choline dehydrogenase [Gammaproteobacteria bacterium]
MNYHYIIVGAGSAGCVLANRLSADPGTRVLLLEAGPMDRIWDWRIHMPAALAYPLASRAYNWYYESEPEPFVDGRRMYCPRGRVLGGSSSINGMVYIRGNALDYDRWARSNTLAHWSYAHCLPYFKKAETREQGATDYRGGDGPLHVSTGKSGNPLFEAFVEAGRQAGYLFTEDANGYQQEGFGPWEMTTRNGRRCSAARAYLHPVRKRANLTVRVKALTNRVVFSNEQAVGVEYVKGGRLQQARAQREVIVCGGAINSPQLLLLSGIGNAADIEKLEIELVADLPGVGQNLQDHIETYVQYECLQPISLRSALKPLSKLRIGFNWQLFSKGIGASNQFEAGGFIRSRAGVEHPDIQYHFLPIAMHYDGSTVQDKDGFQAHLGPMRPTSTGRVALKSKDPRDPPSIQFNYLQTQGDRREFRDGLRLTREIFAQKAFDRYRGEELAPGKQVQSDEEIDAYVRAHVESAYHPCGTCKMGNDDMGVVDGDTKVHGVEGLRVVDASIMPSIVSGNLNAPTIMIAEKAADMILGNPPLEPLHVPVYTAPDYSSRQR